MQPGQPWYVGERGESLATLFLTRAAGVRVEKQHRARSIDLIVYVDDGDSWLNAQFGVEVRSTLRPIDWVRADGSIPRKHVRGLHRLASSYAFPVALMVVNVKSAQAWFAWIRSPDPSSGKLNNWEDLNAELADAQTIRKAVADFKQWRLQYSRQWAPHAPT